jgi:hypothetical protein
MNMKKSFLPYYLILSQQLSYLTYLECLHVKMKKKKEKAKKHGDPKALLSSHY